VLQERQKISAVACLELWQENWSEATLPTKPEDVAEAYHELGAPI
jgi:hypothetical protein